MIKHSMQTYSTGRLHRLVYTPDTPVTASVQCRVYCPGDARCTETHELNPVDVVYEFYYQFRQLGDYLLVLDVDGSVEQCLKAVVNR